MERIFENGRERLKEEIDVIKLLAQLRTINATLSVLRTKIPFTREENTRIVKQKMQILIEEDANETDDLQLDKRNLEIHESEASEIFNLRRRSARKR